jgi:hypothetical protein
MLSVSARTAGSFYLDSERTERIMKNRLACIVAAGALACGRTEATVGVDGSGSLDGAGSAASACFPGAATTNAPAQVGAPCVPEVDDNNPQFGGFIVEGVSLETDSVACVSDVCLVNHFQGRVTCPYGQNASGNGPGDTPGCKVPATCDPITVAVQPQISCRTAADAVYCSCRCANAEGKTDDGATYCTCPSTMTCIQLVAENPYSVQVGAYCVKAGTEYDALDEAACSECDPTKSPCP